MTPHVTSRATPQIPPQARALRVLYLISGLAVEGPLGGVERHVIELARALDKAQIEPIVGGLWHYGTLHEELWRERLLSAGIETFLVAEWDDAHPYQSCVRAWRGLPGFITKPVDIIHSHGTFSDLAAISVKRHTDAKRLVRTVHNEFEWSKRPRLGKFFPRLVYPFFFQGEYGVSWQVVDNLNRRRLATFLRRKATVLHNSINLARFAQVSSNRRRKRIELGLPTSAPVIGSVGRLTHQKGYDVLLSAVPLILAQCPNAYFVIVGAGEALDTLKENIGLLGLEDRVLLLGARADVEEILPAFDLFVSPSRWEGLPTVVLEAMASRVPVVGTAVSGTLELITHETTGLLVEPDDSLALASALLEMLEDSRRARQMADAAYQRVHESFSMDALARRHEEIYRELV